jgi:hypothetical protein
MDVRGTFAAPVPLFLDDPRLGPAEEHEIQEALMGDIVRPGAIPMRLVAEVIGTAPIERVDVMHGARVAETVRPYTAADLGRRVRVLWMGAEYRGRGRETQWEGALTVSGNRIERFEPVNFLNPERQVREMLEGISLAWTSVTTGNLAGIDLWLEEPAAGNLSVETNVTSGEINLSTLSDGEATWDGGGLGRMLKIYRLPEVDWSRSASLQHSVQFSGSSDLPVYVRVTQADGHQAWSSPIYLVP